jgi:ornithine decarboxylase
VVIHYINEGIYHTFSGVIYDHWLPNFRSLKGGKKDVCDVVGPTCDSFDKISLSVHLPGNLTIGDYLMTENIGVYSIASSTNFNGFNGARIIQTNLCP